ncbi:hypothetical protein [Microbulbifer taiwanensis]|uniref:Uncharacterized protein n=1 Tax=Microbulbifer taiwanensis TaxID=986746 RepID=A0ABW1YT17_9GAMM
MTLKVALESSHITRPGSTLRRCAPPPDGLRNALRAKNATAAAAGGVNQARDMKHNILHIFIVISLIPNWSYAYDRLNEFYEVAASLDKDHSAWQCYTNSKYQGYIYSKVFEKNKNIDDLRKFNAGSIFREDVKNELISALDSGPFKSYVHAQSSMMENCFTIAKIEYPDRIYTCNYYDSALFFLSVYRDRGVSKITAIGNIMRDWKYLNRPLFVPLANRIYGTKRSVTEETFFILKECLATG